VLSVILLILVGWVFVAVCAWAAVYSARTWRRPDRRHRMRAVSYTPRGQRPGGVF
jgi:threonine/homoserine/homoserine lactone efflux protein